MALNVLRYRRQSWVQMRVLRALAVLVLASLCVSSQSAAAALSLGHSIFVLNGPWKFHVGDNPRWASPTLDDKYWERVDLTSRPGAHDSDVGLNNYVPGWSARGHRGYIGYAWYRLGLDISDPGSRTLWLAGPADVDNAYQVYFNGQLIGGIGDFSHTPPLVLSIQPRMFALPRTLWTRDHGRLHGVLAFRVALVPGAYLTPAAERGGIHIAPLLGDKESVSDHYHSQWMQTIAGYSVDGVEGVAFVLLALMALTMMPFDSRDRFYPWLAGALALFAIQRGNQPFFFLSHFETMHEFVFWRLGIVDGLTLGAWTMAWHEGFKVRDDRWFPKAIGALTMAYVIARVLSVSIFTPWLPAASASLFATVLTGVRLTFLALLFYVAWKGIRTTQADKWLGLVLTVLTGMGLYALELSEIGIPGIWFPFGVGVSLSECVDAVLDVALFVYLARRLWAYAAYAKPRVSRDRV